jgi:hypothetical protein
MDEGGTSLTPKIIIASLAGKSKRYLKYKVQYREYSTESTVQRVQNREYSTDSTELTAPEGSAPNVEHSDAPVDELKTDVAPVKLRLEQENLREIT